MTDNAELHERRLAATPRGWGSVLPRYVVRAENAELWDVEGNRLIDFAAGIAVVNTGHRHPRVVEAASAQLEAFTHTCFMVTPYESVVSLAEKLNDIVPGGPNKTLLVNSGAEAVENAVKIARAHTGRPAVVAFSGGFHGRTMMTLALTGKINPYKLRFGPFPGDVFHVPFPYGYHGVSAEDSLAALDELFASDVEPDRVAALVVEPVLGEGGFVPVPEGFLASLRRVCDRHGIVMVVDEVQTGFGRTGEMLAIHHTDVVPDLVTMAKSLAGGFPLSAVTGRAEIMDAPLPGGLGGTYGGSPLAVAAANAVIDTIAEEGLLERARQIGRTVTDRLGPLVGEVGSVGEVRGLGAMMAVELATGGDPHRPAKALAAEVVGTCAQRGLLVLSCGVKGNVVRLLPPLTISDDLLDEGLGILVDVITELG